CYSVGTPLFFQAEDGIRDFHVTGVQTCALPIFILCIGIAFVVSSVVLIAAAEGELDAIPQRWDPVFHANGIRYIAETGDGGLYRSEERRVGKEGKAWRERGRNEKQGCRHYAVET